MATALVSSDYHVWWVASDCTTVIAGLTDAGVLETLGGIEVDIDFTTGEAIQVDINAPLASDTYVYGLDIDIQQTAGYSGATYDVCGGLIGIRSDVHADYLLTDIYAVWGNVYVDPAATCEVNDAIGVCGTALLVGDFTAGAATSYVAALRGSISASCSGSYDGRVYGLSLYYGSTVNYSGDSALIHASTAAGAHCDYGFYLDNYSPNMTTGIYITETAGASPAMTYGIHIDADCGTALQIGASGSPSGDIVWYGTTANYLVRFDEDGDTNGAVYFGADTYGFLTQWYGDVTGYYVQFDPSGDTNGAWYFGADTLGIMVNLYGDVTGCGVFWDPSGDTNGQLAFGASGGSKGIDVVFYGDTNGAYVTWDRSVDDMIFSGAAQLLVSSGLLTVGADAAAGTLTMYPGTTTKGMTTWTMADNAGDTTTNVNVAEQAGARTYTIPDAGADATFLMTDAYKTWWSFGIGLSGEDTDGIFTNGAGMCGGTPDSTTNGYSDGAGTVFVKVYDAGDAAWDDLSTSGTLTGWANNYQLQPDAASEAIGDAVAIGFATKFCEFGFDDLATNNGALATYSGDAGKWQYSTGAGTWSDLTVYDGTDLTAQDGKRPFQRVGAISFAPPSDWVAATYDGQEAYWVQWVFTGAQLTQTALIDDTNKDEPFIIVAGSDAFDAPFKATIGEVRVTDMGVTVHDQAIKFVVGNFTTGVFTEEFTWTASQYNDTFTPATPLAVAANDVVGVCITDDAGSTVNPVIYVEFEATYLD